jgi:hypothetical protein
MLALLVTNTLLSLFAFPPAFLCVLLLARSERR